MDGTVTEPSAIASRRKPPGSRERTKQLNQKKIIIAARGLFTKVGYEAATLRQIAADAGVGLATLFTYINDKRDLVYLVFNKEVERLTDKALAAPQPWQAFPDKILAITELHFRAFGRTPTLSRILLSEILIHTPGHHLKRHFELRARLIRGLCQLVLKAQQSGEVHQQESAEIIAQSIFFLFSATLRWWLAGDKPKWREGQILFEKVFRVQTSGFVQQGIGASSASRKKASPTPGAERLDPSKRKSADSRGC